MKNLVLMSLMVMVSSSAFADGGGSVGSDQLSASKPYYICSLERQSSSARPDAEILVQFDNKGQIAVKGTESTGTCIGRANYFGSSVYKYGAAFEYISGASQNEGCRYAGVLWYATEEGHSAIDIRHTVTVKDHYADWAEYRCK